MENQTESSLWCYSTSFSSTTSKTVKSILRSIVLKADTHRFSSILLDLSLYCSSRFLASCNWTKITEKRLKFIAEKHWRTKTYSSKMFRTWVKSIYKVNSTWWNQFLITKIIVKLCTSRSFRFLSSSFASICFLFVSSSCRRCSSAWRETHTHICLVINNQISKTFCDSFF